MNSAEITLQAALDLLGLRRGAGVDEIQAAFRRAAKFAHPDAGGSEIEFARIRAALDHLRAAATRAPAVRPARADRPGLAISPLQALHGGAVEVMLESGSSLSLVLEPGLREGDRVEVDGKPLKVAIRPKADIEVHGDDLWVTVPAPPHGGRMTVETPLGARVLWIGADDFQRGILRYPGQGLPARGRYRAGDLVLKLVVESEESQLARRRKGFLASWAA
ncbi:MAG: heat shock protein DnaJ domain protein [Caulobacteraceae bacterium]|nr:heat shock protein DnaJ domain protein [Caulobacteraceae bacterium]